MQQELLIGVDHISLKIPSPCNKVHGVDEVDPHSIPHEQPLEREAAGEKLPFVSIEKARLALTAPLKR